MQDRLVSHLAVLSLVALAASAGACGGGSANGDGGVGPGDRDGATTPAPTSGVPGAKTVTGMTAADNQKICDWTASLYGGYGGQAICDDGSGMVATITGPSNQAACLAQAAQVPSTCTATVSQVETCTRAISTCDPNDDVAATEACTAMFTCIPSIPTGGSGGVVAGTGGARTGGTVGSGGSGTGGVVGSGGSGVGGAPGTRDGGAPDAFGTGGTGQTGGASGVTSTGGSTVAAASGGATTPGATGNGGTTTPATTGAGGIAGTTGTTTYEPLCSGLVTAQGIVPIKGGSCTGADPQLCYKTCGPQSIGFKSEICSAGAYEEQSGCSYPPGDYSCYKIPSTMDPSCGLPQVSTVCSVAPCTVCNFAGIYLDSLGATKPGYCICPEPSGSTGISRWICAASTSWPCPAGQGC